MSGEVTLHEEGGAMSREAAAQRLRDIADELARGNGVRVTRGGTTLTVRVPDRVELSVELEQDGDGMELEIEIAWSGAPIAT